MGRSIRDLSNQTFGRLTVIAPTEKRDAGMHVIWQCRCECGNVVEVSSNHLASGSTRSCGCLQKEATIEANRKYQDGETETNLYRDWQNMKDRCYNPNNPYYHHYGGRGIEVCPEWTSFEYFKAWSIRHEFHEGCGFTLDRIDNDGDYTPDNCQWLTRDEHAKKTWQDRKKKRESSRPGKQVTLEGVPTASA